jgi:hypothetical protein
MTFRAPRTVIVKLVELTSQRCNEINLSQVFNLNLYTKVLYFSIEKKILTANFTHC